MPSDKTLHVKPSSLEGPANPKVSFGTASRGKPEPLITSGTGLDWETKIMNVTEVTVTGLEDSYDRSGGQLQHVTIG